MGPWLRARLTAGPMDSPVRQVAVPPTDENDLALVLLWIRWRCLKQCPGGARVWLELALVGSKFFWVSKDRRLALRRHLRRGVVRSRPPNGSAELRHPFASAISIGEGPRESGFNSSLSSSLPNRPA